MFDPTAECPECSARLSKDGCRDCGWKPTPEPERAARPNFGIYREVPDRTALVREPISPEMREIITKLKHQLEVVAPRVRAKAVETFKRCEACETGRFVHLGTRFCLACYSTL